MNVRKFRKLTALAVVPLVLLITGCLATRKFVRNSQAPQDTRIQSVDQKTAQNAQDIKELSDKTEASIADTQRNAEQGVQAAKQAATQADEHAQTANQAAENAIASSNQTREMIHNLQNYQTSHHTAVTFGLNKSTLTTESMQRLDEVAQAVGSLKLYVIKVQGYTDKTGPVHYNLALSQRRAEAVVRYLTEHHEIPLVQIHSLGYGESAPVASNDTREGRQENRRVEVTILVPQLESQTAQSSGTPTSDN